MKFSKVDTALLTALSELLAPYSDDEQTFWDTLEGECDVMDVAGELIKETAEIDAQIVAVNALIETYRARKTRLEGRKEAAKKGLLMILKATDQAKIPHALGTVSLRAGSKSVVIHDEKEIPTQLCKTTIVPDKAAIKKQLEAGETIDGAELVTGPDTVSIRIK